MMPQSDTQDAWNDCHRELIELRREIARNEGKFEVEEIIHSGALGMLSLMAGDTMQTFNATLMDAEVNPFGSFHPYAARFQSVCARHYKENDTASRSKKPPSMTDLHARFVFRNPSASGSKPPSRAA